MSDWSGLDHKLSPATGAGSGPGNPRTEKRDVVVLQGNTDCPEAKVRWPARHYAGHSPDSNLKLAGFKGLAISCYSGQ